jgi:hypothetical protein
VLSPREVQQRRPVRQCDAVRGRQLIDADLCLSSLERPGKVMDVPYLHPSGTLRQ